MVFLLSSCRLGPASPRYHKQPRWLRAAPNSAVFCRRPCLLTVRLHHSYQALLQFLDCQFGFLMCYKYHTPPSGADAL